MENMSFLVKVQREGESFFESIADMKERVYLFLFTLYIFIYFIINIEWSEYLQPVIGNFRYAVLSIVMWGASVYLIYVIVSWKKLWDKIWAIIMIAVPILLATGFFSMKMSTNSYGVVMDIFFCVMAYGKSFKKMLQSMLGVTTTMLLIAGIGVPLGFTVDLIKPDNIHPGHSLGIIYPNTWGNLVFLALILLWYLYLRNKPLITFAIFWGAGAFMFLYIYSRTMSIFSILFPIAALVIDFYQNTIDKNNPLPISNQREAGFENGIIDNNRSIRPLGWAVVIIPFLALGFVIFASMQMEWVHKTFYYTWFHNFAMRFVQGGFYLKTYGMPVFGNPYRGNVFTYMYVNGEYLQLGNLDSAYISYIIMRGMVWTVYTLLWLCVANWKALKKQDYAIPFLCTVILLFAMMERIGLEMWYNFILLYPLANVDNNDGDKYLKKGSV